MESSDKGHLREVTRRGTGCNPLGTSQTRPGTGRRPPPEAPGSVQGDRASMTIEILNWLELPGSLGIERDRIVPMEFRNADYDEKYDFRTLFYDAIFVPQSRAICLICPKLLNLSAVVKDGLFASNDQRLKPKIMHQRGRYDEIWLECSGVPDCLRIRFGTFDCEITVGKQNKQTFKGLRCAVLKSKDNDLEWIKDWAEYHVKVHGLQGLVFFDNGSEKYSTEDVHNALLEINGLEKVRVLSAPFPFGPVTHSTYKHSSKFLTGGLLNIARLRYFQSAAAVLVTDVDELVAPTPAGSVFALAERSPFGYVAFRGRLALPGGDGYTAHSACGSRLRSQQWLP